MIPPKPMFQLSGFYYSRSQKVGNPIASILKSSVKRIPALFGLNQVSNFMGFTVYSNPGSC